MRLSVKSEQGNVNVKRFDVE